MIIDQQAILNLLHRMAWRFTRDYHNAEDLAQVTLIKAWLGWKPEMAEWNTTQLNGWLTQIMKRAWIDTTRMLARRPTTEELCDLHDATGSIETGVEQRTLIEETLTRIPEKGRVLLLLDAEKYTYEEMAAHEEITCGAVAHRLMRAKQAFKREWATVAA